MLKLATVVLATALSSIGAFAQELPSSDATASHDASFGVLRYEVRADLNKARASGAWPVRESNDVQASAATNAQSHKAKHRLRKEYPNVMGMSIDDWLASREAAAANTAGE
jgi:hypothetical protein